jgi:hypothetical protein
MMSQTTKEPEMSKLFLPLILAGALSLTGCSSAPRGDAQRDAALKTFATPADVAGIYIYRNERMGGRVKMPIEVDGAPIGFTTAKTYLYTEVAPGHHTIISQAENVDNLELEVQAGENYYIWQEVKMGAFSARNKLHLVDEVQGQSGVRETRLTEPRNK